MWISLPWVLMAALFQLSGVSVSRVLAGYTIADVHTGYGWREKQLTLLEFPIYSSHNYLVSGDISDP